MNRNVELRVTMCDICHREYESKVRPEGRVRGRRWTVTTGNRPDSSSASFERIVVELCDACGDEVMEALEVKYEELREHQADTVEKERNIFAAEAFTQAMRS